MAGSCWSTRAGAPLAIPAGIRPRVSLRSIARYWRRSCACLSHLHRPRTAAGVRGVVSAGASASQRARGPLGREPAGRSDDVRERPALAHRHGPRRSGSSRTIPHLARSYGPPGARWPPRARWRAATVSCRSSRYARTGRTGAGETTILRWPRSRRSRSRWEAWSGRLLAMCSRWPPSWPPPAPHRDVGTTIGLIPSWPATGRPHGRRTTVGVESPPPSAATAPSPWPRSCC
jgi:hypothetical protein